MVAVRRDHGYSYSALAARRSWTENLPREQQTTEELGTLQKSGIEKWWPLIKAAGVKAA
jgi:hypothetical protein